MSKIYGYCRISTKKQNIKRQERNIKNFSPDAFIIKEIFTGTTQKRPEFEKLLSTLKNGDTIIFDSVSRMSRNADEGFKLYEQLYNKGVNLVFLKEPHINTATYKNELEKQITMSVSTGDDATDALMKGIFDVLNEYILRIAEKQILLAFEQSQKELDDLRQRTREGIETARRAGKQIGGHKEGIKIVVKKAQPIKEIIKKYSKNFDGTLKDNEVIAVITSSGYHVSHNTFYKYKKELKSNF